MPLDAPRKSATTPRHSEVREENPGAWSGVPMGSRNRWEDAVDPGTESW
jgi:hypothetical protein